MRIAQRWKEEQSCFKSAVRESSNCRRRGHAMGKQGVAPPLPYPLPSSAAASAVMRGNKKVDTAPELAIRRLLHSKGFRYRVNYLVTLSDLKVRSDLVFTRQKVAVFVDGCFWHGCPVHGTQPRSNALYWRTKIGRNQQRDQQIDRCLSSSGWTVVRVWEHEKPGAVVAALAQTLHNASSEGRASKRDEK